VSKREREREREREAAETFLPQPMWLSLLSPGLAVSRPRFFDSAAPPGTDLFPLSFIIKSPLPGLGAYRPRFLDSAAPPGAELFLSSPYSKLATSRPGRLHA
jgi:hypothetical protein